MGPVTALTIQGGRQWAAKRSWCRRGEAARAQQMGGAVGPSAKKQTTSCWRRGRWLRGARRARAGCRSPGRL
eukprot:14325320-Alexandrium_andersonii.AAC.1